MKNIQTHSEDSGTRKSESNNMLIKTLTKTALALLAAGTMAVIGVQTAQAQGNGTSHSSFSFSVTAFDGCTGELVDINVTDKADFHVLSDNAGGFHLDIHDVYSGLGVGETTGTVYIANQTDTLSINAKVGQEQTAPLHFEMVSKGGSPNLEVHGILHVTVNANGVTTAFVDISSVSCK
jgi:hypothetical protein